jgi:hypothetical protein
MAVWWIGNVVLIAVVLPVVVVLLRGVLAPVEEIEKTAAALAKAAPALLTDLDDLNEVVRTQQLVHEAAGGIVRYGNALGDILG